MLGLPRPAVDALGRPVWNVSMVEVSKSYRKLSILVHPDKNPGEDARRAFEALNTVYRKLKAPEELEQILRDNVDAAKSVREAEEAAATLEDKVKMMAKKKEEQRQLRKEECEELESEILQQMKERQKKALQKKRSIEARGHNLKDALGDSGDSDQGELEANPCRAKPGEAQSADKDDSSDDEDARRKRRKAMARRKRR